MRASNTDQACTTLLNDRVLVSRTVPCRQPRVAGAERWVASERQLLGDRKYANAIVRVWIFRREHERRLGDV
jgi:hypothetical protein